MSEVKYKILNDILGSRFSLDNFNKFTRELLNGPNMLPESRKIGIWREYDNHINAYYIVANYKDPDDNNVVVLAVELKKGTSVERARSMQRNFISKVLDANNYEGAIVAFYTPDDLNWRLSLVRLDYTLTAKGVELDLTPAKRFSYLVGENEPNHTSKAQLLRIFENEQKRPTLDELEEAFSVEKVTKDFFNEYKEKYLDLKEYLEKNEEFIKESNNLRLDVNKFAEQFSKKLMGQLAFLYFLQKKGWLGVRLLPENRKLSKFEFEQIYNNVEDNKKTILKKVFKLNPDGHLRASAEDIHSIDDREAQLLSDCFINTEYDMAWGSGNREFIRGIFDFCNDKTELNFFDDYLQPFFYDALNRKRKNHYFKRFNCKIPFLNGGLFEPIEGYHWDEINFEIPNILFSNKESKNREADGILDIFDRYNFTMNEDEPLEKEVAIDPEMLGKIFENLLDVSDRKSKGAFYTPREIVHYMCQESLINYLVNKVEVPYDDMKEFILYGEMIRDADNRRVASSGEELTIKASVYKNIVAIDDALKNVKVADPAVGSGAFPLGMLNEIVKARNNITEYIIRVNKEGEFGKRYDESFIRARRSEYKMKWETIKNSIFAVDIEPSAVDIAKLRLWLSVVVDQEIDSNNPEPHPLPNLDQNIMVGNSLIDEFEGIQLFDKTLLYKENASKSNKNIDPSMQMNMLLDQSDELLDTMFKLQDQYFGEDNESRKKELKAEIDNIRDELIMYKLQSEGNLQGLKKYEESLKNKTKPYFIWELEFAKIFKDNGGFDIVIGNPPYVQIKKLQMKNEIKDIDYQTFSLSTDLYCIFLEKSNKILKEKGIGMFITSNKWLRSEYGKLTRSYFVNNTSPSLLVDFGGVKIFETASVDTSIFGWNKILDKKIFKYQFLRNINDFPIEAEITEFDFHGNEMWIFLSKCMNNIKQKMEYRGKKLLSWDIKFHYGILTGANPVFLIDRETKDNLSKNNKNIDELIVPIYRGKDINRYSAKFEDVFLINTHNGIKNYDIKPIKLGLEHKRLIDYFEGFGEKFKSRGEQGENWYNLRNCAYLSVFEKPKIIYADIVQGLGRFYYDEDGYYTNDTAFIIYGKKHLKYLTGILNSKAISFAYKFFYAGLSLGEKGLRYKKEFLEKVPIPEADLDIIAEIESLVDQILKLKMNNLNVDTDSLEERIDNIVYRLYGFTKDEIERIENEFH